VSGKEIDGLFKKGLEALAQGNTLSALSCFEKAINIEYSPVVSSYYAFCIAKARGQVNKAVSLCEEAIKKEPKNSLHYLNLGRIYLIDNNQENAIKTFREGLNYESNQQISDELNRLGPRKPPIIPYLKRSNLINKYLGIILRRKKRLRIQSVLIPFLLVVTVASILLILFLPEKQNVPSQSSEDRKETLVEAEHDTLHTLELIATETTSIVINIDDGESTEVLLNYGERIKWSAKNGFALKIGNAGGVKLLFDGREIGPLGEKGQVISLKLPPPIISGKDKITIQQRAEKPKPAENKIDETPKAPDQGIEAPKKSEEPKEIAEPGEIEKAEEPEMIEEPNDGVRK
jgi:tetratricopeptide (TPR) repeat protein